MDSSKNIIFLVDSGCIPYDCVDQVFSNNLKSLRLTVLKILTYFSSYKTGNEFRWSHKVFSTSSEFANSLVKHRSSLNDFSLESFEEFEDTVNLKLTRLRKTLSIDNNTPSDSKFELGRSSTKTIDDDKHDSKQLSKAVREILHEFDWNVPQILSPVKPTRRSSQRTIELPSLFDNNYVFVLSSTPCTDSQLREFVGGRSVSKKGIFVDSFLPPALLTQFVHNINIRLFWIDTTSLFKNKIPDQTVFEQIFSALKQINGGLIPINQVLTNVGQSLSENTSSPSFPDSALFNCHLLPKPTPSYNGNHLKNTVSLIYEVGQQSYEVQMLMKPLLKQDKDVISEAHQFSSLLAIGTVNQSCFWSNCEKFESFVCLPSENSNNTFELVIAQLLSKKQAMIVSCADRLSLIAGVIVPVMPTLAHFLAFEPKKNLTLPQLNSTCKNVFGQKAINKLSNVITSEISEKTGVQTSTSSNHYNCDPNSHFTVSSIEKWFVPNHKFADQFTKSSRILKMKEEMRKKLKLFYKPAVSRAYHRSDVSPKKKDKGQATKLYKSNSGNLRLTQQSSQDQITETVAESDEDVVKRLKELSKDAVEGQLCLLTCAQNITTILGHHTNQNHSKMMKMLEDGVMLSSNQIAQMYDQKAPAEARIREYEYQVLILFESHLIGLIPHSQCLDKVVLLLRTLSFLSGPATLATFLSETLFNNYLPSLESLIVEICEELNQPLPDGIASAHSSSSDEEVQSNLSSIKSEQMFSQCSTNSSASSNLSGSLRNRYMRRQSSFSNNNFKRQIIVPKVGMEATKNKVSKSAKKQTTEKAAARRNLFPKSPGKMKRRNTTCGVVRKSPSKGSGQSEMNDKCPLTPKSQKTNLMRKKQATTPRGRHVLKTTYVPATPEHKEGSLGVLRRQQQMRRRTLSKEAQETIEESPDKAHKTISPMKSPKTRTSEPSFKTPVKLLFSTPSKSPSAQPDCKSTAPKSNFSTRQSSKRCLFKTPSKLNDKEEIIPESPVKSCSRKTVSFSQTSSPEKPSKSFSALRSLRRTPERQSREADLRIKSCLVVLEELSPEIPYPISASSSPQINYSMSQDESFSEVFTSPTIPNTSNSNIDVNFELSPEKMPVNVSQLIENLEINSAMQPDMPTNNSVSKSPESTLKDWRRIKPRYGKDTNQFDFAPQRFTRKLASAIGLSPETVRNLSTLSPNVNSPKKRRLSANQSSPLAYSSPSTLSIVHLTTSPMVLRNKSPQKPFCRKRLMDDN